MEDRMFRCRHCKKLRPARSADQRYCGHVDCQKARKNAWRRAKYEGDPDYRANQRESTEAWLETRGGSAAYYREYRKRRQKPTRRSDDAAAHPAQDEHQTPTTKSANSDAKTPQSLVKSGRYRLLPYGRANSDAVLVDLLVIPGG